MWKRILLIWPAWILGRIARVNQLLPGSAIHRVSLDSGRDVGNLLDQTHPHLKFTSKEEALGEAELLAMGIPRGVPFVCLNVRDHAYMDSHLAGDWSYHNYRDCDIRNFVLAAEELAERGYFVIRMGAKVHKAINTANPKVIDYASNGMRSDFMDIYLAAKCSFCITTGSGWDGVAVQGFRKPAVFVDILPLAHISTYSSKYLLITKRHILSAKNRELTLREIFAPGVGDCTQTSDYESNGVRLVENTPEEIRDVAIEMAERLNGTWQSREDDEALQKRFWEIFPIHAIQTHDGLPLHGEIRARFGAHFLRNSRDWLS